MLKRLRALYNGGGTVSRPFYESLLFRLLVVGVYLEWEIPLYAVSEVHLLGPLKRDGHLPRHLVLGEGDVLFFYGKFQILRLLVDVVQYDVLGVYKGKVELMP